MARLVRKLSDTECRKAKPLERDYKLYDEGNLRLLVRKTGTKVWQYPYKLHGKENIYTIGQYPHIGLAESLNTATDVNKAYLKSKGLLPDNLLHICPDTGGSVLWHTKAQEVDMYFSESLCIPNGKASVPPLVWKAGKDQLSVYAVKTNQKPKTKIRNYPLCRTFL